VGLVWLLSGFPSSFAKALKDEFHGNDNGYRRLGLNVVGGKPRTKPEVAFPRNVGTGVYFRNLCPGVPSPQVIARSEATWQSRLGMENLIE
jgi:hypothetical protein